MSATIRYGNENLDKEAEARGYNYLYELAHGFRLDVVEVIEKIEILFGAAPLGPEQISVSLDNPRFKEVWTKVKAVFAIPEQPTNSFYKADRASRFKKINEIKNSLKLNFTKTTSPNLRVRQDNSSLTFKTERTCQPQTKIRFDCGEGDQTDSDADS